MKKEVKVNGALNQGHLDTLTNLANFIGADSITYIDKESTEVHLIEKNGKTLKMISGTWGKEAYTNFYII